MLINSGFQNTCAVQCSVTIIVLNSAVQYQRRSHIECSTCVKHLQTFLAQRLVADPRLTVEQISKHAAPQPIAKQRPPRTKAGVWTQQHAD